MILSMTGFGRTDFEKGSVTGFLEIRSLNHRHLDISVKLPETLRPFEKTARKLIKARVNRGKIDCYLNFETKKIPEECNDRRRRKISGIPLGSLRKTAKISKAFQW